jgi:peroxiredoxin
LSAKEVPEDQDVFLASGVCRRDEPNHFFSINPDEGRALSSNKYEFLDEKGIINLEGRFDLLSDKHCQIARDYGIVFEVSDPLKQLYTELGHPLPDYNGTEDWLLPVPAIFIIDRQQQIALAHIDVDYRKRYEPTDAIAILLSLFVPH